MKTIILLITLTLGALQADNIVTYDTQDTQDTQKPINKPNHPSTEIY
ncbi:MAG: hypothetical protein ACI9RG_000739 [Sulfurimonas sp.]|jgi:hypothetical protein